MIAAFAAYLWWHFQYPFYFIWDMDHTVLVDTVLIQSGKWPVHLHHPGFGLYLPLKWSHFFSYLFGFTSIFNIADMEASVGPILGVAELTDYLRIHSPLAASGIVLLLWRTITLQFSLSGWKELALFVLLAVQASLFYHSTMIRTELYAVFWWALALYAFTRSTRAATDRRAAVWVGAGGLFLALCLLSKIQAIIYLAAAAVLLALFRAHSGGGAGADTWAAPRLRKLSAANLAFALFLIIGAALRRPYGATFTGSYNINFVGVGFVMINLALFAQAWGYLPSRLREAGGRWLAPATLVMSGFLLGFLLHFTMYANPGTSYRYMLLDAKMVFFRNSLGASLELSGYVQNLAGFVARHPALYSVLALFLALFALRRPPRNQLFLVGAAFLVAFLSAFYGSRNYLRDLLWAETLVLFLVLFLAAWLSSTESKGLRTLVGAGLLVVLAGSCASIARLRSDLDANYNHYGWAWQRMFDGTYYEGHLQFAPSLHARYGHAPSRRATFRQALQYREVRRAAAFVVANGRIDMKALGLAEVGQPVFAADPGARIEDLPEALRGGILIDAREVRLDSKRFFEDKYVNDLAEALNKRRAQGLPDAYSLLPRDDLQVFVVAEAGANLDPALYEPAGDVRLQLATGPLSLRAWRLKAYVAQPKERLGARHFLVVTGI